MEDKALRAICGGEEDPCSEEGGVAMGPQRKAATQRTWRMRQKRRWYRCRRAVTTGRPSIRDLLRMHERRRRLKSLIRVEAGLDPALAGDLELRRWITDMKKSILSSLHVFNELEKKRKEIKRLREELAELTESNRRAKEERRRLDEMRAARAMGWTVHVPCKDGDMFDEPLVFPNTLLEQRCYRNEALGIDCHHLRVHVDDSNELSVELLDTCERAAA